MPVFIHIEDRLNQQRTKLSGNLASLSLSEKTVSSHFYTQQYESLTKSVDTLLSKTKATWSPAYR